MTDTDSRPELEADAGTHRLMLFVCAANVCRSPAMEFLTAHGLREHAFEASWALHECWDRGFGTAAHVRPKCGRHHQLARGAEFVESHRSRPLTSNLISRAGLILVSSRRERSAVARLAPAARARTFTMVEAALVAESAVSREISPWRESGPVTLERLATVMCINRGLVVASEHAGVIGRLRARSRRPSTLDIGDVHIGHVKGHEPVLEDLHWASEHLSRAFATLTAAD